MQTRTSLNARPFNEESPKSQFPNSKQYPTAKNQLKKKQRIEYDKESKVLSIELRKGKSSDSDIFDNLVIDYDKAGNVVRVNLYGIDFSAFKEVVARRDVLASNLGLRVAA